MEITTIGQADKAGLELLGNEAQIAKARADAESKIAGIREDLKKKLKSLERRNKTILEAIGDWALTTTERDPGTKGQITMTHTRVTIKEVEVYRYPAPLAKVIQKARKLGLDKFVRVKEELNKDLLRAEATPDQLSALGVKVLKDRTAYIEARDQG